MRYTLRQLEVFLATARHESVSQAAVELALSQSAVSGALRDLEKQFDVVLFDRVGKRLYLSEFGRELRAPAEDVLARARELEQSLGGSSVRGRLRVGATLTIGNYLAVPMIAAFRERYPEADVQLEVANTASIAARVADYTLDMGLVEGEFNHPDLSLQPWRGDELCVFAAPGHPVLARGDLDDVGLVAQDWILREPGSGTRQAFDRAMHGILASMNVVLELQHTEAIKRAVEAGLGLGCLSRISLEDAFRRGSLVPVAVPGRDLRRGLGILLHRQKYQGPALRAWLALCRERGEAGADA